MFTKLLASVLCTLLLTHYAHASGFQSSIQQELSAYKEKQIAKENAMIGKTLYAYFPNKWCKYPSQNTFIQKTPEYTPSGEERYMADKPTSFTIIGVVPTRTNGHQGIYRYYQVRIEDGTIGYIATDGLKISNPDDEERLTQACVFEITPQEMQAKLEAIAERERVKKAWEEKEDKERAERWAREEAEYKARTEKREKEAAARAKMPSPRIGMSEKQVIERTSWGRPQDINRTTTPYGVEEQWVYGMQSYLYFRNGRLVAIQD